MPVYIYGLFCPVSDDLRYIGKSVEPEQRLRNHICSAKKRAYDHHTSRWIRKLMACGQEPVMRVLCEVAPDQRWQDVERAMIEKATADGIVLTNSTIGGEGLDYADPEDAARYRANLSAAMRKFNASEEGREAMQRTRAGLTPEVLARRAASIRARYKEPSVIAQASAINSEIGSRPEVKAKRSLASRAMWTEKRDHFMEVFAQPETKAAQSEKRRKAWADPDLGAMLRAVHGSAESRAKKSEAARRRNTPEYRALLSERLREAWIIRRAKKATT